MADHLARKIVQSVALVGVLIGGVAFGVSMITGTSFLSLFDNFRKTNEVAPIEDQTGVLRANGYISEGDASALTAQNGDTTQSEAQAPDQSNVTAPQTAQNEASQVSEDAPSSVTFDDPIRRIAGNTNGTHQPGNDPAANVRQPREITPELQAALERQRREDDWRAERARLAAEAPLPQTRYTVDEVRDRQRQYLARQRQEEEGRVRAAEDARIAALPPVQPTGHVLAAGTVISATLMDNLDSELPGLVRAWVNNDVWDSDTMRTVVIPRGSQLLGEYASSSAAGQRRLQLTWTRVRLPDGRTVDLDNALGLDESGRVGVEGRRRNGFLTAVFQTALLNMAGNIGNSASSSDAATLAQAAQMAMGQSVSQVGSQYINDRLARGTVFRVDAGERINVQITRDFLFPDEYQQQGRLRERSAVDGAQVMPASMGAGDANYVSYDRALYGDWADADGDCQNTRHEMLQMLSTGNTQLTSDGCAVATGRWLDPYTGRIFTNARDLDIDHLVPLAWAHAHGGYAWDAATRAKFANDPVNLFAVDAATNRAKGAQGPDTWLPPDASFQCQYILRFERVVQSYGLTYNPNEASAISALRDAKCGA